MRGIRQVVTYVSFWISLLITCLAIVLTILQIGYQQRIEKLRHPDYIENSLSSTTTQYPLRLRVHSPAMFWAESLDDAGLPIYITLDPQCAGGGPRQEYALYLISDKVLFVDKDGRPVDLPVRLACDPSKPAVTHVIHLRQLARPASEMDTAAILKFMAYPVIPPDPNIPEPAYTDLKNGFPLQPGDITILLVPPRDSGLVAFWQSLPESVRTNGITVTGLFAVGWILFLFFNDERKRREQGEKDQLGEIEQVRGLISTNPLHALQQFAKLKEFEEKERFERRASQDLKRLEAEIKSSSWQDEATAQILANLNNQEWYKAHGLIQAVQRVDPQNLPANDLLYIHELCVSEPVKPGSIDLHRLMEIYQKYAPQSFPVFTYLISRMVALPYGAEMVADEYATDLKIRHVLAAREVREAAASRLESTADLTPKAQDSLRQILAVGRSIQWEEEVEVYSKFSGIGEFDYNGHLFSHPVIDQVYQEEPALILGGLGSGKTITAREVAHKGQRESESRLPGASFMAYAPLSGDAVDSTHCSVLALALGQALAGFIALNPMVYLDSGPASQKAMDQILLARTGSAETLLYSLELKGLGTDFFASQVREKWTGSKAQAQQIPILDWCEVAALARPAGFTQTYILLDISSRDPHRDCLEPLLEQARRMAYDLASNRIYLKLFMPADTPLTPVWQLPFYDIHWSEEQIRGLVEQLEVSVLAQVKNWNRLDEPDFDHVVKSVMKNGGTPRTATILMGRIARKAEQSEAALNKQALKELLNTYQSD